MGALRLQLTHLWVWCWKKPSLVVSLILSSYTQTQQKEPHAIDLDSYKQVAQCLGVHQSCRYTQYTETHTKKQPKWEDTETPNERTRVYSRRIHK